MIRCLLILVLLNACGGKSSPHDDTSLIPGSSSASRRALEMPNHASSRAVRADSGAVATCDALTRFWGAVRLTSVAQRDTIVQPLNRDAMQEGVPDEQLSVTSACVVVAVSDSGNPVPAGALPPPINGWVEIWPISADGPDGRMQTLQRGVIRCQVTESWDGGDDADSTVARSRSYGQETVCWRHNRPVGTRDTLRPH